MDATVARVVADLASPPIAWHRPVLVAITGLPGTGKTELATCLAAHFPLIVLSTDAIRRAYGLPSGPSAHGIMYAVAAALLKGDPAWSSTASTSAAAIATKRARSPKSTAPSVR